MKIGIIIAMDKEMSGIMSIASEVERLTHSSLYEVYRARYGDKMLYIVKSGIGEIAAAAATQYLITAYGTDIILNFGVCGKLNPELKVLQTVAISSVVHYQHDLSAIDNVPVGYYEEYKSVNIPTAKHLLDIALSVDGSLKTAVCASGDKFIDKKEDRQRLFKDFNADVCEMESAGVLLTCNRNNTPCLIIKSISDDEAMGYNEFSNIAAERHTDLIEAILKKL